MSCAGGLVSETATGENAPVTRNRVREIITHGSFGDVGGNPGFYSERGHPTALTRGQAPVKHGGTRQERMERISARF